jgi:hypothetical protein
MNPLMRDYLIGYDQHETIRQIDRLDREKLLAELPQELAQILSLPILQDADDNYLIATKGNKKWVRRGDKPDYSYYGNHTWFECDENKVNLRDFEIAEEYSDNLERQSEQFLKFGLFFSLLLFDKLSKIEEAKFKVILVFSLFRYVDTTIKFHAIRADEFFIKEGFEKQPFTQGILTLEA